MVDGVGGLGSVVVLDGVDGLDSSEYMMYSH